MKKKNTKSIKQKQYTTIRIFTSTHQRIKKIAEEEQRNIDIVANRLLDESLQLQSNSEILSQAQ